VGEIVNLLQEPDARDAPVRFDEREQETELGQTGLRRPGESFVISHREATATASVLDFTRDCTQNAPAGVLSETATFVNGFRKLTGTFTDG